MDELLRVKGLLKDPQAVYLNILRGDITLRKEDAWSYCGGGWQGCTTSAPCTYVISRATVSGSSCPATTGTNYTPLNQSAPVSGLSYTDNNVAGLNVCYIAQTLQGSAVSQPSNVVGPFQVQAVPLAPNLNQPTQSEVTVPPLKSTTGDEVAGIRAPVLTAKLIPVR